MKIVKNLSGSKRTGIRRAGRFIIAAALILMLSCSCTATNTNDSEPGQRFEAPVSLSDGVDAKESSPSALVSKAEAGDMPAATMTPVATTKTEPSQAVSYAGQVVCTADEYVNIRSAADLGAAVIGVLPSGETADVISYEDTWAYISYDGIIGYVSRGCLIGRHSPDIAVPTGDWAAILVNPTHHLPGDFNVTLADFEGGQVDERILEICRQMFADAKEDGVTLTLADAYRSHDRQNKLYQEKVERYIAKGLSREDAEIEAAKITARPDTSEHQTGLALDIVTPSYTKRNKGFAETEAFKWLDANAQDYGFILRYDKEKVLVTKIIYEPWHWRFVGTEAAAKMKESGACYEAYWGRRTDTVAHNQ